MRGFVNKNFLGLLVLASAIIVLLLLWGIYWVSRPGEAPPPVVTPIIEKPVAAECPEGTRPIVSGKETYKVLTEKYLDPRIMEISFDPLDVKPGETQTVTVKVHNPDTETVTSRHTATVSYLTDNGLSQTFPLRMILANGKNDPQADENDLITTWQGSIPHTDTHCTDYMATVIAKNDNGEHKTETSVR